MMARPFAGEADILFFVAMLVGALNLLLSQVGNLPGFVIAVVVVAFGGLLVAASLVMLGKRVTKAQLTPGP